MTGRRRRGSVLGAMWGAALAMGLVAVLTGPGVVRAAPAAVIWAQDPDLFDPESGLRLARYSAPTPSDIPGARRVSAAEVRRLVGNGAVAIDVTSQEAGEGQRATIPNAVWLPEAGEGLLFVDAREALAAQLKKGAGGDLNRPVVVFAETDLWLSWNAARRIALMGYSNVNWYPEGVDHWRDLGWALVRVGPGPAD